MKIVIIELVNQLIKKLLTNVQVCRLNSKRSAIEIHSMQRQREKSHLLLTLKFLVQSFPLMSDLNRKIYVFLDLNTLV